MKLLTTRKQCEDYLARFTPMEQKMCIDAQIAHDALEAHYFMESSNASLPKE